MSATDSRPEVGAEADGQLGGDHPAGRAVPGGVTAWPRVLMRPSMLVWVPVTSPGPAAASTMSARPDDSVRKRSTAMTVRAPARARGGQLAVGEVGQRVGAEQDQDVDLALGRGGEDAGGVEPGRRRDPGPHDARGGRRRTSSVVRPGSRPGARPMSRAPWTLARRSSGRTLASGRVRATTAAASTV